MPHCQASIPGYNRLKKKYKDDIYIIAVENYGLSNEQLKEYVKDKNIQYDTVAQLNARKLISYFENITHTSASAGAPALLIFSRDGNFAKYFYPQDLPENEVDEWIQKLL